MSYFPRLKRTNEKKMDGISKKICRVSTIAVVVGICVHLINKHVIYNCPSLHKKTLVIGILSARDNFQQRQSLRNTWLQNMRNSRTQWTYTFIVGHNACDIHHQNRKTPYDCERILLKDFGHNWEFSLFSYISNSEVQQPSFVYNVSIRIHHPVIIKQLGLVAGVTLKQAPITVALCDEFREEVVIYAKFSESDEGHVKAGYRYQTVETVLLPEGFQGSLHVSGVSLEMTKLLRSHCSLDLSNNIISVTSVDSKNYPTQAKIINATFLASMYLCVSEQDLYDMKRSQQQSLDDSYRNVLKNTAEKLEKEMEEYGDILLVDVIDVYRNLPQKLLKFHEWVNANFDADFAMKTDDDCFVDVKTIISELNTVRNQCKFWWGNFRHDWFVERFGKWAETTYRAQEYPAFACGSGNVVSKDISDWISRNSKDLFSYQGEDTSMGIWLSAIGPSYVDDSRWKCEKMCESNALVIPELSVDDIYLMWNNKLSCGNPCTCGDASRE